MEDGWVVVPTHLGWALVTLVLHIVIVASHLCDVAGWLLMMFTASTHDIDHFIWNLSCLWNQKLAGSLANIDMDSTWNNPGKIHRSMDPHILISPDPEICPGKWVLGSLRYDSWIGL
ncbi:uncharacterized protein LACBIDRAFT_325484 [Laccaria bicolor S238N-H82]|uniref:Predicted protein n=1 Tax=Laccaria bicolor (strain S238N-H82 / ATCC MYA-4686) TaxID=486041 RepID=B0D533_LACBS|nr:uncharacterized protein LACBIDRAFT_325484 [Laccaria bicolor S238N-H82]EDR10452.1 predicted protein [Laccaria bicolor S238N-H82]|eukprot:XP_001878902.1 predicted protein [Laccaria bicolor S238N-H82]